MAKGLILTLKIVHLKKFEKLDFYSFLDIFF